jgi:ABC-type multidrug transport system permease subunit
MADNDRCEWKVCLRNLTEKRMEPSNIVDISLQILAIILLISVLLLLIILYRNVIKFLRIWDRFYGNYWLYGRQDFE